MINLNVTVEGCGIVAGRAARAPVHADSRAAALPFSSSSFFHTISLSPAFTLVRDGQTSPLRPRLVVSRSTCPPLSPSPHANSFVKGTAVINTRKYLSWKLP
jgi:hypothetical protein